MLIKPKIINIKNSTEFKLEISFFTNLKFNIGAIKKNVIDEIISILFEILKVLNLSIDIPCAPSKAANTSFELT